MHPRALPSKIALLAGLLALPATCARAADAPAPAAAPAAAPATAAANVETYNFADPRISKPEPAGAPCVVNLTEGEKGKARETGVMINNVCLPQQDAFKQAAEAASYLAFYQQNFSDYGVKMKNPEKRKEIQESIKACLDAGDGCSGPQKSDLLQALIQYNFGKELKAQMIENESRAERMKSIDPGAKEWKAMGLPVAKLLANDKQIRAPGSGAIRKETFRLDPRAVQVFEADKVSELERAKLGGEFANSFNSFVDEYSSSTGQRGPKARWHYVTAKTSAFVGGKVTIAAPDFRNEDTRQGKAMIDKARLEKDMRMQSRPEVQEIVASFKEQFKDVTVKPITIVKQYDKNAAEGQRVKEVPVDSMVAAYNDMGFGLSKDELAKIGRGGPEDPENVKQVVAGVVVRINAAITKKEDELKKETAAQNPELARMPSSSAPGGTPAKNPIVPSVTVDVDKFSAFLDDIWPGGAPKPPSAAN